MTLDPRWVALSLQSHIGGKTLRNLLQHFDNDLSAILDAVPADLMAVPGIGVKMATAIKSIQLEQVMSDIRTWQAQGVRVITRHDAQYPALLTTLEDEPPTLFMLGEITPELFRTSVAIVGTRKPTSEMASRILTASARLARDGVTVVSGLALGVDQRAHEGSLSIRDGRTVAVLGSGILNIYPAQNVALAGRIRERGLLLCECDPTVSASTPRLVSRNRIISGLSSAVIVAQTEVNGGAMHAARSALAQGRRLYTFDLPFSGNQNLLAFGAQPLAPDLSDLATVYEA